MTLSNEENAKRAVPHATMRNAPRQDAGTTNGDLIAITMSTTQLAVGRSSIAVVVVAVLVQKNLDLVARGGEDLLCEKKMVRHVKLFLILRRGINKLNCANWRNGSESGRHSIDGVPLGRDGSAH